MRRIFKNNKFIEETHIELKKISISYIEQEVRNIVLEDNRIDSVYRLVWNVWYNVVNCG